MKATNDERAHATQFLVMSEGDALQDVRARIDAIDRELLRLLNERAQCAIEVGRIKRDNGTESLFYRPEREADVLRRVRDGNPGPLPAEAAVRVIREIMSACLALEQPLHIGYLGPAGTYAHAAAERHFGGAATFVPLAGIDDVVREVEVGSASFGVVPVENSLEGPINQTHDVLFASSLRVCGEVLLAIHHQLLSRAPDLAAVRRIYAHSQALAQCRRWLDTNCPNAERIASSSNAEAARRVRDEPDAGAIAGVTAATLYELPILAANIEDRSDNTTRFWVVGRERVPRSGDDLTSLAFSTPNRAGALCDALRAFAVAGISMTRLQSRPQRQGRWDYVFFVDILGHEDDPTVAQALQRLGESTSMCRVLGAYPRAVL